MKTELTKLEMQALIDEITSLKMKLRQLESARIAFQVGNCPAGIAHLQKANMAVFFGFPKEA